MFRSYGVPSEYINNDGYVSILHWYRHTHSEKEIYLHIQQNSRMYAWSQISKLNLRVIKSLLPQTKEDTTFVFDYWFWVFHFCEQKFFSYPKQFPGEKPWAFKMYIISSISEWLLYNNKVLLLLPCWVWCFPIYRESRESSALQTIKQFLEEVSICILPLM